MAKQNDAMSILMQMHLTAITLNKRLDRALSIHGISFNEYLILHFLDSANQGTTSRVELAEALGITASGITRMLNPMEKIHLIEKHSNARDARVSLVKLSQTGKQIYKDASVSFQHLADAILPDMRQYQADTLLGFLARLK